MGHLLKNYKLLKSNQGEIICIVLPLLKKWGFNEKPSDKDTSRLYDFIRKFCQTLKKLIPIIHNLSQKLKEEGALPYSSKRPGLPWYQK